MAVIHHNALRVNAVVSDDADQLAVLRDSGWAKGLHKDSDPDDRTAAPRVLPAADPDPEPAKAKAKADTKES
jgi:hypothetical protein